MMIIVIKECLELIQMYKCIEKTHYFKTHEYKRKLNLLKNSLSLTEFYDTTKCIKFYSIEVSTHYVSNTKYFFEIVL